MEQNDLERKDNVAQVQLPKSSPTRRCDLRAVLSFVVAMLFVGAFVCYGWGLVLYIEWRNIILPVFCLLFGLSQMLIGAFLLIPLKKVARLTREESEPLKSTTKIYKRIILIAEIILCLIPLLWMAVENSLEFNQYSQRLQGSVFGTGSYGDSCITYTFTDKNTCIYKEYDITGYTPIITNEKTLRYSVVGNLEEPKVKIDGVTYETYVSGHQIRRIEILNNSISQLDEGDIPIQNFNSFAKEHNATTLGSSGRNTNATNDQYITAAKSALMQNYLKFPDTVVWNEAKVHATDGYGQAIVYLDYTAENNYGMAVRSQEYVFVNEVQGSKYWINTVLGFVCEKNELEIYKIAHDFGKHPEQEKYAPYLIEGEPTSEGTEVVSDTLSFDRHICSSEKIDYVLYADQESKNLSAIKITLRDGLYSSMDEETQKLSRTAAYAAMRQIKNAQTAQLVHTGSPDYDLEELLSSNINNDSFERGGIIVSISTENEKTVISIVDGFRYGFTEENYWTPLKSQQNNKNDLTEQPNGTIISTGYQPGEWTMFGYTNEWLNMSFDAGGMYKATEDQMASVKRYSEALRKNDPYSSFVEMVFGWSNQSRSDEEPISLTIQLLNDEVKDLRTYADIIEKGIQETFDKSNVERRVVETSEEEIVFCGESWLKRYTKSTANGGVFANCSLYRIVDNCLVRLSYETRSPEYNEKSFLSRFAALDRLEQEPEKVCSKCGQSEPDAIFTEDWKTGDPCFGCLYSSQGGGSEEKMICKQCGADCTFRGLEEDGRCEDCYLGS